MRNDSQRRRYYQNEENVPLSEAIREAVQRHSGAEPSVDVEVLAERTNTEAIDHLYSETDDVPLSLQVSLPNVLVNLWGNEMVDIRVTERRE